MRNRRVLLLTIAAYAGLLLAIYLFVSTREATISQLILTLVAVVSAPALFFVVQAVSVSYPHGSISRGLIKKSLRLVAVSLPVLALTLLTIYGLNKIHSHPTIVTAVRYLLLAVVIPLLAIQLWIAGSNSGLRSSVKNLRKVLSSTFAPRSVFVYACGFLIFAVVPYYLLQGKTSIQRPWLELSLLFLRIGVSAILILIGWVTTVGAISILTRSSYVTAQTK
ncbi:MAG TPA: hypothetical protein VJT69_05530 [Pyrinomonadaceae bacterium]|nr:hypothetical protein [Pyrinomonadaceae bacterium]